MSISFPLSLPTDGFAQIGLRMRSVSDGTSSPYTGAEEIQVYPGQWWEAKIALPSLRSDKAALWEAFFGQLNGREGTFLLGDPIRKTPRGAARSNAGTPSIDLLHAPRLKQVQLKGLPADVAGYLLRGDHIQINTGEHARLHQVLVDVDTNEAGKAIVPIWPAIRYAVADETPVVVSGARGCFRLATPVADIERSRPLYTNISIDAREVVP